MSYTHDAYPTRVEERLDASVRKEAIIHSPNQSRWEGPLDEVSLSKFERDGFLWFEGFFSQRRMQPFFQELSDMLNDSELMSSDQLILDPETGDIRSVFGMHELSRRFSDLTRDPRLLGMVRQILGSDVYIHQSRINDKPGHGGAGFEWHSDFETWHSEDGMPGMRAISASIMLSDNNSFNGPLMLIPGSHHWFLPCQGKTPEMNWKESLKAQEIGVPHKSDLEKLTNRGGIQAPVGPPGSLLLFECNTLHASNCNMSPWPRSNLFFVYNSVENKLNKPFAGTQPRPEFLAARNNTEALSMLENPTVDTLTPL